jgi:TonB family protein
LQIETSFGIYFKLKIMKKIIVTLGLAFFIVSNRMKNIIFFLLLSLIVSAVFSQDAMYAFPGPYFISDRNERPASDFSKDLMFDIRGAYKRPVIKEILNDARKIGDISPGFPTNWLNKYVSAEIQAVCNGKSKKAMSTNEILSAEQKDILKTADLGTDVIVNIRYKSQNSATEKEEVRTINYSVTIIPEVEAKYSGGQQQLLKYFRENAISKITEIASKELQYGLIKFTINEQGEIIHTKISKSTGDSKVDKLLVDAIKNMPKWNPAENSMGIKVKQEFVFSVGNSGC